MLDLLTQVSVVFSLLGLTVSQVFVHLRLRAIWERIDKEWPAMETQEPDAPSGEDDHAPRA